MSLWDQRSCSPTLTGSLAVRGSCEVTLFLLCADQAEVKLGNPLLVLLQSPSQLLSHLLFDRQVSPER